MSREIKFRAWNGKAMEFGGFSVHATGQLIKDSHLGDVFSGNPLMQYTGLKDKRGVEIYEGDIVLVKGARIAEVIFLEASGCWDLELIRVVSNTPLGIILPNSYKYHAEIIGNIYNNPELLVGEK